MLRPGGRFLAARAPDHAGATGLASHGWTPEQAEAFAELARAHGFTDVRVERHPSARRRRGRGDALAVLAIRP